MIADQAVHLLCDVNTFYLKEVLAAPLEILADSSLTMFLQQHSVGEHGLKSGLQSTLLAIIYIFNPVEVKPYASLVHVITTFTKFTSHSSQLTPSWMHQGG